MASLGRWAGANCKTIGFINRLKRITELDTPQYELFERMVETMKLQVTVALENKITQLDGEKLILADSLSQTTNPKSTLS